MIEWPRIKLGRAAEIRGGATPRRSNPAFWSGDIPWVTPTDLPAHGDGIRDVAHTADTITKEGIDSCSASLLPPGTVLFSSRATIGKIGIAVVSLTTNQGFANLIPCPHVESRYLAWCLHYYTNHIAGLSGSTTFREVSKHALKSFRIPVPSISEQRRIVDILDQADDLRRLRTQSDAKADSILPALFIKMFGDPAMNPMGWPVKSISEVCKIVSGATPKTNRSEFWGGEIQWATPKDLSGHKGWILDHTERTLTQEGLANCSATMMPEESVLLSSRAPIGLVAVAGVPICTNQGFKSLVCGPNIDPWYLFGWCRLRSNFLQSLGQGATFREISKRIVESITLPVPPMHIQQRFRTMLMGLMANDKDRIRSTQRIADLFYVLLTQAFSGDLTVSWREAQGREFVQEMEQQAKTLAELKT